MSSSLFVEEHQLAGVGGEKSGTRCRWGRCYARAMLTYFLVLFSFVLLNFAEKIINNIFFEIKEIDFFLLLILSSTLSTSGNVMLPRQDWLVLTVRQCVQDIEEHCVIVV